MLWTVLWLVGGIAGGLVAAWMLISAAGMDARRGLHGRSGVMACGACGHEAVTPDRISACPECGEAYADAGLLTPRAGLRYGPPMPIIGLLLLSGVVLGSALLAPQAGMAANRSAIGGAQVESRRMTSSLRTEDPRGHGATGANLLARLPSRHAHRQEPRPVEPEHPRDRRLDGSRDRCGFRAARPGSEPDLIEHPEVPLAARRVLGERLADR